MQGHALERRQEHARLAAALEAAGRGGGSVLAVTGPAGIGKTTLLDEALAEVPCDVVVRRAAGTQHEQALPFGVARSLLAEALADPALLRGPAAPARAIAGRDGAPPDPLGLLHALHLLVRGLAERSPLVLAVDDAHWCDTPTLRLLAYLGRRLDGLRVLVLVAARPAEGGPLLDALLGEASAAVVRPRPLSTAAVAALVRARLGAAAPTFTATVHGRTGGTPLLVHGLLDEAHAAGLRGAAEDVLALRRLAPPAAAPPLARLGGDAAAVAEALAVLGGDGHLRLLPELTGLDEDAVLTALERLEAAGVLRPGVPLDLAHPVVRTAVYAGIGHERRTALHAAAAAALLQGDAPPERVALHLRHTPPGGDAAAARALRAAGELALHQGEPETAADLLERALTEGPAPDDLPQVRLALGQALARAARRSAAEHLRAALDAGLPPDDHATAAVTLAQVVGVGDMTAGVAVLEDALAGVEPGSATAATLLLERAAIGLFVPELREAVTPRIAPLEDHEDPVVRRQALVWRGAVTLLAGDPADEVAALALAALDGEVLAEALGPVAFYAYWPAFLLLWAGRLDEAEAAAATLLEACRRTGALAAAVVPRTLLLSVAVRRGDLDRADAEAESARRALDDLAELWPRPQLAAPLAAPLTQLALERGDVVAALAHSGDEAQLATDLPELQLARAQALRAAGKPEEAVMLLERLGLRLGRIVGADAPDLPWRSELGLALAAAGDPAAGVEHAQDEVQRARRFGEPITLGVALRAAGTLLADRVLLEEAVTVLARTGARLELARALEALGRLHRTAGDRDAARDVLLDALELAAGCGAHGLAAGLRAALADVGARPRRAARRGAAALTRSERRVAELAAEGLSNPEIADVLVVTRGTVEAHLSGAFRKLGIRSRSQLPAVLGADPPCARAAGAP